MTQLRDARFKRALDAAPDAQLRPDARVRAHIRDAARAAAPSRSVKWWKATGSGRPVWGAAFASIALATLVTLLWYDREIPDAGVTSPSADKQAPVPVQTASTAAQPASPMQSPGVVGQSQVTPRAAPAIKEPAKKELAKDMAPAPVNTGSPSGASSTAAPLKQDALRDQAAPALSKAAAPAAKAEMAAPAAVPAAARPPAAPPAAAPAAAPAFAPPPAAVAPAPVAQSMARESSALRAGPAVLDDNWNEASIEARGRSVRVPRSQADRLPSLLAAIARGPAAAASAVTAQPSLQIGLTGPGGTDTLEIAGTQVRWTRVRDSQPRQVIVITPDAALLQALQAEAERLLAR